MSGVIDPPAPATETKHRHPNRFQMPDEVYGLWNPDMGDSGGWVLAVSAGDGPGEPKLMFFTLEEANHSAAYHRNTYEGHERVRAVLQGRKAVGIELKESYFRVAVQNCVIAEERSKEGTLFNAFDQADTGAHAAVDGGMDDELPNIGPGDEAYWDDVKGL